LCVLQTKILSSKNTVAYYKANGLNVNETVTGLTYDLVSDILDLKHVGELQPCQLEEVLELAFLNRHFSLFGIH
jgi:hypothetical protein